MGSRERCAPVQVILWLNNVHHLVRVELKHAFHFGVLCTIGGFLSCFARFSHLDVLPSLALPDPPEVSDKEKGNIALRCNVICKAVCHSMYCSTSRNPRTKAQPLSVMRKKTPNHNHKRDYVQSLQCTSVWVRDSLLTSTYPWQAGFWSSTNSDYENEKINIEVQK